MSNLLVRSFTPDLEVRAKGGGRTIVGIAVPYDTPQRIDHRLVEQFAQSVFNRQLGPPAGPDRVLRSSAKVKFSREHLQLGGTLIGVPTLLRDDAKGLYGEFRVAKTLVGDETIELVKDGALSQLSIAFLPAENRTLPGGIVQRVQAELKEVAVVLEGAYGDMAAVMAVRARQSGHGGCPHCGHDDGPDTHNLEVARQITSSLPLLPSL